MKPRKLQALTLALLILSTNPLYATTPQNTKNSSSQTLTDTDGDGYFAITFSTQIKLGMFSLRNDGKARVDVTVYSASTGNPIWSTRVNPNKSVSSASNLSLGAGKYYFIVVSDGGGPLNVTCTANY